MKENNNSRIQGAALTVAPLLVAAGIQILIAAVGFVVFLGIMIAYDKASGIEWYIDRATRQFVGLYTEQQNALFLTITTIITELVMLAVAAVWYAHMKKNEVGIRAALTPITLVLALILGVGMQGVTSLLLNIIYYIFPESWTMSYDGLMDTMLDTTSPLMVISVAVLAPIAEELFFRGIALNYGRRYFPTAVVIIAQAVGFGIFHGNPVQFTYATMIGIVFGLVAVEFQSVWPGILIHIGVNASAEVLSFMEVDISVPIMALCGIVLSVLAIAGYFLSKKLRVNKK